MTDEQIDKLYVSVLHWHEVDGEFLGYISDNREMVAFFSQWWQDKEQEMGNSASFSMHTVDNVFEEDIITHLRKLACDVRCSPEIRILCDEEKDTLVPVKVYDMNTGWTAQFV